MKTRSTKIGEVRLDFYSHEEVAVTENIPGLSSNPEENYIMLVPFLFTARVLFNFPPPTGSTVVKDALATINEQLTDKDPNEFSLLGVCSGRPVKLVERHGRGQWVYKAKFIDSPLGMVVDLKIDYGDEDYFHRASIDAVFEWFKNRLKELLETDIGKTSAVGITLCFFIKYLFENYDDPEKGVENQIQNYRIATECAEAWVQYLSKIGGGNHGSEEN